MYVFMGFQPMLFENSSEDLGEVHTKMFQKVFFGTALKYGLKEAPRGNTHLKLITVLPYVETVHNI